MAAPGANYAYANQLNKNYVSSVAFLDQREILNKILDVTNEESSFLDIMELTGRSQVTNVPVYHHFVNQELYVLGATTGATSGTTQTLTLATTSPTYGDGTTANAYTYAQAGDLVLLGSGAVAYVTSKPAANQIAIKALDGVSISVGSGEKITFFSNAAGEGSLSPEARRWGVTKYLNQVQTFKAKFQVTDIQKASKVEVEFNGKPFFMYKGQHESLMKFRGDISNALMFGKISASTAFSATAGVQSGFPEGGSATLLDAESNPVSTTMGLDQYASLYGYSQTTATASTYTLSELQTLTQQLNRLRAPQEYFLFVGTTMNIAFDNMLNALGNSGILTGDSNPTAGTAKTYSYGGAISANARINLSGSSIELGIDKVKIYGRTFYKKYLPILDHPYIVNTSSAHKLAESAYGVPATKQKTLDSQMLDRIQVRYMANDGTDLKYREILLGGLAPVPTNERSVLEIHYQSTQGLQILGANHLFKIKSA